MPPITSSCGANPFCTESDVPGWLLLNPTFLAVPLTFINWNSFSDSLSFFHFEFLLSPLGDLEIGPSRFVFLRPGQQSPCLPVKGHKFGNISDTLISAEIFVCFHMYATFLHNSQICHKLSAALTFIPITACKFTMCLKQMPNLLIFAQIVLVKF